jgi:hypothetical protein
MRRTFELVERSEQKQVVPKDSLLVVLTANKTAWMLAVTMAEESVGQRDKTKVD